MIITLAIHRPRFGHKMFLKMKIGSARGFSMLLGKTQFIFTVRPSYKAKDTTRESFDQEYEADYGDRKTDVS